MKKLVMIALLFAAAVGLLAGCTMETVPEEPQEMKIALVVQKTEDPFREALLAGAQKAASEQGMELLDLSPELWEGTEICQQIQEAVASGCHALIASPDGSEAVAAALQAAADAGVQLVCVEESGIETAPTVVTDQRAAGKTAGEVMLDVLKKKRITEGRIAVICPDNPDECAVLREEGFREAFAGTAYTMTDTYWADGETGIHAEVAGIFCCNEAAALEAGNAVVDAGTRIPVVCFGNSDAVVKLVEEGGIRACLMPQPEAMGYEAVMTVSKLLQGIVPENPVIDAGVSVLKTQAPAVLNGDYKIVLITPDRVTQAWIDMDAGAMKAVSELGCEVVNLSPMMKNEEALVQQIEEVISSGCDAIVVAAEKPETVREALKAAVDAGVKVVCLGFDAGEDNMASISADPEAAGKTAAETMIAALEDREIGEGAIGIIGTKPEDAASSACEAGFREAFAATAYTLLETRYSEGDAARSHTIAEEYLEQDVTGIFCVSEGGTVGAGNAVSGKKDVCVVGFGGSKAIQKKVDEESVFAALVSGPEGMGYEGIKAACAVLNGEVDENTRLDSGVAVLKK